MVDPLNKHAEDAILALRFGRSAYDVGDYELAAELLGRCEREAHLTQSIALDTAGLARGRQSAARSQVAA
jgi:hypothetical protein